MSFGPSVRNSAGLGLLGVPSLKSTRPYPQLDLNFLTGSLDPRITFTRATTGTYVDSAGVLQSAAINAPRFDYSPTTLALLGLLVEPARTNSLRNNTMQGAVAGTPGTFPTNWTVPALGTLSQTIVGVGATSGIEYIDVRFFGTTSATSFSIGFDQNTQIPALSGQAWTNSTYFAVIGGSETNITSIANAIIGRNSIGTTLEYFAGVDRKSQTTFARVSNTATFANASTVFAQSSIVFTFASGVAIDITIRIGLPQLELGAGASSVIKTTTTALSRSADVPRMTGTNFSDWYNAENGTMVVTYDHISNLSTAADYFNYWAFSDGTSSNRMLQRSQNGTRISLIATGGVSVTNSLVADTVGVTQKIALAYSATQMAVCGTGVTAVTTTTLTSGLPVVSQLGIGVGAVNEAALNGHIKAIQYYPRRVSNGELTAFVTV